MLAFLGVSSAEDLPVLDENCMVFLENYKSFSFGLVSVVYGRTIVMDNDKYCEYVFVGISSSKSLLPLPVDGGVTKGYVYNVSTPDDYCGLFLSGSANLKCDAIGGAVAPNGVYATIISGEGFGVSSGLNVTYYFMSSDGWIYDKADIQWIQSMTRPLMGLGDTSI